jgi:hypothetical protein
MHFKETKSNDAINRKERNQDAEGKSKAGSDTHFLHEQRTAREVPTGR